MFLLFFFYFSFHFLICVCVCVWVGVGVGVGVICGEKWASSACTPSCIMSYIMSHHTHTMHTLHFQIFKEQRCAFGNCRHLDEPGCVIRGDWERYEYYVSLRAELQERFDLEKKRAASKKRRQGTVRYVGRVCGLRMGVHISVCVREREGVCVCERERECVCVCVCERERERGSVCVRERGSLCGIIVWRQQHLLHGLKGTRLAREGKWHWRHVWTPRAIGARVEKHKNSNSAAYWRKKWNS